MRLYAYICPTMNERIFRTPSPMIRYPGPLVRLRLPRAYGKLDPEAAHYYAQGVGATGWDGTHGAGIPHYRWLRMLRVWPRWHDWRERKAARRKQHEAGKEAA